MPDAGTGFERSARRGPASAEGPIADGPIAGLVRLPAAGEVKRRWRRVGLAMAATDAACAAVALIASYYLRFGHAPMPPTERYLMLLDPLLWAAVFHAFSLYAPHRLPPAEEFRRIIGATGVGTVLLMLVSYTSKSSFSRTWLALSFLVALLLELATRRGWRSWQHRLKVDGRLAFRTLIVGTNGEAARLAATLSAPGSGFIPLGHVQPQGSPDGDRSIPVLGELSGIRRLIHEHAADCLFIASSGMVMEDITQVAQVARQEGVEVRLSANLAQTLASRLGLVQVGPVIALSLRPVRLSGAQAAAKRAFDLVVGSAALLLCLPLLLLIAAAIRLTSPGPVLFHQQRVTKGGRCFWMHKFRTMEQGADRIVGNGDRPVAGDPTTPFFKLGDQAGGDPRVTRIGRHLRRLSIDELPQLWNIIKGEMSLIGPRPLPAEQVAANRELLGPRHEVPAGMTGWWQINGRSLVTPEEAVRLDQFYVENWSLTLDLYILWKTFSVVLQRNGAY
jgi:exopolysaccharide biosynthesis polyprenyl glycosylphosphotransferase